MDDTKKDTKEVTQTENTCAHTGVVGCGEYHYCCGKRWVRIAGVGILTLVIFAVGFCAGAHASFHHRWGYERGEYEGRAYRAIERGGVDFRQLGMPLPGTQASEQGTATQKQ